MLPKYHILIGFLVSLIIVFTFNIPWIGGLIIFLSSFLIDVDHYLYYVFKERDISLKNAYNYFLKIRDKVNKNKKNYKPLFIIFHGVETLIILLIFISLNFFRDFFSWILIGFIIHLSLDYIDYIKSGIPISGKLSQIYVYYQK